MPYFSGQGKGYLAVATAGVAGAMRFLGNVPVLDVQFETDVLEHKESTTGQRATDLRLLREKTARVAITLEEFDAANLALALFGANSSVTGAGITAEPIPTMADGEFYHTLHPDISSVVIEDSLAAPLVLNTNYRIDSAKHGRIEFLDVSGFTQPFNIDYTFATYTNVNMLTAGLVERWLRFDGLNTADANQEVAVDLYRVAFDPTEALQLIGDELAQYVLNGSVLNDDTKSADPVLGTFGRIVLPA